MTLRDCHHSRKAGQLRRPDTLDRRRKHDHERSDEGPQGVETALARVLQNGKWSVHRDATLVRETSASQSKRVRGTDSTRTTNDEELYDYGESVGPSR